MQKYSIQSLVLFISIDKFKQLIFNDFRSSSLQFVIYNDDSDTLTNVNSINCADTSKKKNDKNKEQTQKSNE